jgi:Histidine kinase-, DNA gyrase B-, and HSP90-like ATPase
MRSAVGRGHNDFKIAGEVAIKAAATDGLFRLSVFDTGPGISAADQAKLFQEFQQADNSITRKKGGTGLGLAISKRIIEMHGGRIWIDSVVGQGSTFSFTLPVHVERAVQRGRGRLGIPLHLPPSPMRASGGSVNMQYGISRSPTAAANRYLCATATGTTYSGSFVAGAPCTIVYAYSTPTP